MRNTRILFLLKKNMDSAGYTTPGLRAGLYNSVRMLKEQLQKVFNVEVHLYICDDGNSIDKALHIYKPDIAIIEALWVTPGKLEELSDLHPHIKFIVRIHSEIPFMSNEGIAIDWIKEYTKINRVKIAFNSEKTTEIFKNTINRRDFLYLPNLYDVDENFVNRCESSRRSSFGEIINIGCFGAIRPLKNQLLQAFIAINFAERNGLKLRFHINYSRVEQRGESVLKNLRALFKESGHELIEHEWLEREEFIDLISSMDLGMQLSFNESFNIVTADFVSQGVPIIVSEAIEWMPDKLKVENFDFQDAIEKLRFCFKNRKAACRFQRYNLLTYNLKSLKEWQILPQLIN